MLIGLAGCTETSVPTPYEKSLLFTEADFAEYGLATTLSQSGFKKETNIFDRSLEITYRNSVENTFYIYSSITKEKDSADAYLTELAGKTGLLIGLKSNGTEEKPIELRKTYGKRSSMGLLMMKDKPIGNVFSAVVGNNVILLLFSGIYFDDPDEFEKFAEQKMQRIVDYGGK